MRFELAGSLVHPDPMVLLFTTSQTLDISQYINAGYTHFDVICIGAGGGPGGGIDTQNTGTLIRNYGGAGGGGGLHRVLGLLSALPSSCPIVVGAGGGPGNNHISDPNLTTDGGDGGYSSFNDTTCRASGGKGGKRARSNSSTVPTQADGGEGGVGNRAIAGGGADGGTPGIPTDTGPGSPGFNAPDGTFFSNIGQGGGGGAGGVSKYSGTLCNSATAGGRGSYNPNDTSVYGPREEPTGASPGGASGAKAAPVSGLPTVYGRSKGGSAAGDPGVVAIRLTAE